MQVTRYTKQLNNRGGIIGWTRRGLEEGKEDCKPSRGGGEGRAGGGCKVWGGYLVWQGEGGRLPSWIGVTRLLPKLFYVITI